MARTNLWTRKTYFERYKRRPTGEDKNNQFEPHRRSNRRGDVWQYQGIQTERNSSTGRADKHARVHEYIANVCSHDPETNRRRRESGVGACGTDSRDFCQGKSGAYRPLGTFSSSKQRLVLLLNHYLVCFKTSFAAFAVTSVLLELSLAPALHVSAPSWPLVRSLRMLLPLFQSEYLNVDEMPNPDTL